LSVQKSTEFNTLCTVRFMKCSPVAEMGDRLATIDMGRKEGAAVPLSEGAQSWIPI